MPSGTQRFDRSRGVFVVPSMLAVAVVVLGLSVSGSAASRLRPQQPAVQQLQAPAQQDAAGAPVPEVSAPPLDGATLAPAARSAQDDGDAVPLLNGPRLSMKPVGELPSAFEAESARVAGVATWNRQHPELLKEGFTRPLAGARTVTIDSATLDAAKARESLAGGALAESDAGSVVWTGLVRVGAAYRVRLHLTDVDLPKGTRIWVYGADGVARGPVGRDSVSPEHELWCPSIESESVWIEVHVPAARLEAGGRCSFVVSSVVEMFRIDDTGAPVAPAPNTSKVSGTRDNSCLTDISCVSNSTAIQNASRAIGRMAFVSGGDSYVCTGGLLNDQAGDGTPYFLTAHHCLETQSEVSSLEIFFDYRSSTCNGSGPSNPPASFGGTLLATSANSDFTFIRLGAVPAGRWFMGWTTASPGSATLERVSNPGGDLQVYSTTRGITPNGTCSGLPNSNFLYQDKTFGGIAGGSSGSPLWMGNTVVVGQLFGQCGSNPGDNCDLNQNVVDGRFSATFPAISQYLQGDGGGGGTLPGTPTSLVATASGGTRVDLDWTDNTTVDVVFKVERRLAGGTYAIIGTTALNVSTYTDTTVSPGQDYFYRVRALATPGGQYTAYSNEAEVMTTAGGPSAPTNLFAERIKKRKITIAWTDTSNNEDDFEVLISNGSSFVSLGFVSANSTGAIVTGLSRRTTYVFGVRACNSSGCSAISQLSATTR